MTLKKLLAVLNIKAGFGPTKKFSGVLLIFLFMVISQGLFSKPNSRIALTWSFIYQKEDETIKSIDYTQHTVYLETGDKIKFMFQPEEREFIYFILLDTENNLNLIFRKNVEILPEDKQYKLLKKYFVPSGQQWFYLDEHKGVEKFYLLISKTRLTFLEKILDNYFSLQKREQNPNSTIIEEARQKVLSRIKSLQKNHSLFKGGGEKPVPIAGSFRSLERNIEGYSISIKGEKFYAKTIRIQH